MNAARRSYAVTAALTALGFALRFGWGVGVRVAPAWDGELYERGARAIATGLGYSCFMFGPRADPRVPTAYYPVGYPAILGAFYAVLGVAPWVMALVGSLVGALTVALVHRLALRVSSPRAAFIAALFFACMPGQVIFASTPMTETAWGFFLTLAVYLLGRGDTPTRGSLVGAALALAVATYVRPQALLLAPLLPLIPRGTLRERARRAFVVTAIVIATVIPWTVRNCRSLDGCAMVSTNGGGNLAIGAIPRSTGTFRFLTAEDGCRGVVGEIARDRCWRAVATGHIRARPGRWVRLAWTKLYHTWAYEAFPVGYLRTARPDLLDDARELRARRALTAFWRPLAVMSLLALLPFAPRRRRGEPVVRMCVALAVVISATHAVFFGGDRYHLPFAAALAVIASGVFNTAPRWLRGERALRPPADARSSAS